MIKPVRDNVYISPLEDASLSKGGIIIVDQAKERIDQGIVKYVGPDVKDINVGEYVIFPNYSGSAVFIEDEEDIIFIMAEDAIIATLVEPQNVFIPGLYFKDAEGRTFDATYTMALRFITDAVANSDWHRKFKVVPFDNQREKLVDDKGIKSRSEEGYDVEAIARREYQKSGNKSFGGM